MLKKIITILLVHIFLFIPVLGNEFFVEKPSWSTDLIYNGGFETSSSWRYYSSSLVSCTEEYKNSGSASLKITSQENNTPWANQTLYSSDFKKGAVFQASSYVFIPGNYSAGYKFEWYDSDGTMIGQHHHTIAGPTNGFELFNYSFTLPSDCTRMKFYVRLYSTGTIYFDDVSFYATEKAPVYSMDMETDAIFYYSDMKNGFANINLNTEDFKDITDYTFNLELAELDGSTVYSQTDITTGGKSKLSLPFSLSYMQEGKEYLLSVSAYNTDGEYVETATEKIMKFKRPAMLSKSGGILVEGKPFYPVVCYHVRASDFSYVKSIGVNTVQSIGDPLVFLNAAQRYGLKVLLRLYPNMLPAGHPDEIENTIQTVNAVKNHPALLGYMVMDEPSSYFPNHWEYFYDSYKTIRELDPDHLIYMVEAAPGYYKSMGKYVDILAADPYPSSASHLSSVTKSITGATQSVPDTKPVCSIISTFLNVSYFPTIDEVRNMWYRSLFAGADVLGYFCYYDAYVYVDKSTGKTITLALKDTDLWDGLLQFAKSEQEESYKHFLRHEYPLFGQYNGNDFCWSGYIKDDSLYMIVLNMTNQEKKISIPLISDNKKVSVDAFSAETIYGGNGIFSGNGTLDVTLSSNAVCVYKLTPSTPICSAFLPSESLLTTKTNILSDDDWSCTGSASVAEDGIISVSSSENIHADYASQSVSLEKGRKYTLYFDYKSTADEIYPKIRFSYPAGYFELGSSTYICDYAKDSAKAWLHNSPLPLIQDNDWHTLRYDFYIPEHDWHSNILTDVNIQLKASSNDNSTFYFDNIYLALSEDIGFVTDISHSPLSALPLGETIIARYSPVTDIGKSDTFFTYFALYRNSGDFAELVDSSVCKTPFYTETSVLGFTVYTPCMPTASFTVPKSGNYTLTTYIWNGDMILSPIAAPIHISTGE